MTTEDPRTLVTRRTAIVGLAMIAAFAFFLYLEGRIAWGKAGFGIWSDAWTSTTSQNLFDPYTLSHFLHGVIFYWVLRPLKLPLHWRLIIAVSLEIGWELIENSPPVIERYRSQTASLDYTGDSILNSIGDVIATIVGFAFASRFSWKVAIAAFVVAELLALYLARDNLTLNVLLLVLPLEGVVQWQLDGLPR